MSFSVKKFAHKCIHRAAGSIFSSKKIDYKCLLNQRENTVKKKY